MFETGGTLFLNIDSLNILLKFPNCANGPYASKVFLAWLDNISITLMSLSSLSEDAVDFGIGLVLSISEIFAEFVSGKIVFRFLTPRVVVFDE